MRLNVRWAAALAAGPVAVPTAAHAKPVSPEQLAACGIAGRRRHRASVRSVRPWDAGVRWDEINPSEGSVQLGAFGQGRPPLKQPVPPRSSTCSARPLVGGEHLLRRRPLRSWHRVVPQEEQVLPAVHQGGREALQRAASPATRSGTRPTPQLLQRGQVRRMDQAGQAHQEGVKTIRSIDRRPTSLRHRAPSSRLHRSRRRASTGTCTS